MQAGNRKLYKGKIGKMQQETSHINYEILKNSIEKKAKEKKRNRNIVLGKARKQGKKEDRTICIKKYIFCCALQQRQQSINICSTLDFRRKRRMIGSKDDE